MKPVKQGKPVMVHEFFTEERIAFNRECSQHTELCYYLAQFEATTEEEIVGVVASYLKCELDGAFTPEDLAKLYTQFTAALKQEREQAAGNKLLGVSEASDG